MIHWSPDPVIFTLGPLSPRWYGFCFAFGFAVSFFLIRKIFKQENKKLEDLDTLLMYSIAGTIIGARLGHCLFYEPAYYLSHPLEILFVWKGGLASHGGTLGMLFVVWLFLKKHPSYTWWWLVDRMCVVIGFTAGMIRMGNLMNSEIIGLPTNMPWAFIFERVDELPRHPTQLYESISYFLIFLFLYSLWKKKSDILYNSVVTGLFMILVFSARFFLEFTKTNQAAFEEHLPLTMGQILSIPFVAFGIYLIATSRKRGLACSNIKHAKKNKKNTH